MSKLKEWYHSTMATFYETIATRCSYKQDQHVKELFKIWDDKDMYRIKIKTVDGNVISLKAKQYFEIPDGIIVNDIAYNVGTLEWISIDGKKIWERDKK